MIVKTIEVIISGRVQKVGFRACVRKLACDLKIKGTVINMPNGKVRVFASGDPMILEKFVSMIYSCPRAVIREMQTEEVPLKEFSDFSIIKADEVSKGL